MSIGSRLASLVALCACVALFGCKEKDPCDVVLYTYLEQLTAEPPVKRFEQETGLRVCATYPSFETKTAGILGRLVKEKDHAPADVLWAEDPVHPHVVIQHGLVVPYQSPQAASIPAAFKDPGGMWTGVGGQARVLLVNTKLAPKRDWPMSIHSLAERSWKGRVAMPNPEHGNTLVQMAALSASWGEPQTQRFLHDLGTNDVRVASTSWEVKGLVEKGTVALGLTNSDHAYEALKSGAPVAVIYPDQEKNGLGALVIPTSVLLLRGPHPEAARRLVDYLLSPAVETLLSQNGAYFPLRPGAPAHEGMKSIDEIHVMAADFGRAGESLERVKPWIQRWHDERSGKRVAPPGAAP